MASSPKPRSASQARTVAKLRSSAARTPSPQSSGHVDAPTASVTASAAAAVAAPVSAPSKRITIWNSPGTVLLYFCIYIAECVVDAGSFVVSNSRAFLALSAVIGLGALIYRVDGQHQETVMYLESLFMWYGWWIGLGIASSIGLGTGLHTFMLFLAPFIAETAFAAYSCQSLNFATRGPQSFVCPTSPASDAAAITIWTIAHKVRLETFFWGLGTAIGELPPYFVARAAAVAGKDDPEFASIERILEKDPNTRNVSERAQIIMHNIVTNLGFFGILLCASVPNPLFDLAGIICGHFSIPFATFFGATVIGKSIIKSNIQAISVVIVFSEEFREALLATLRDRIPFLHSIVERTIESQASKFRINGDTSSPSSERSSPLSLAWNTFMALMILYFVISIIESLALSRLKAAAKQSK
ncbi:hypothetical protein BC831DRAFT_447708 [Entophlyctis helioformis]|nr:hypothetical protein BC831DRAFT_447708 [Entophlyctis helioformis]